MHVPSLSRRKLLLLSSACARGAAVFAGISFYLLAPIPFYLLSGEIPFRRGRGRRAARWLANAAAWTPTARRNLPHIPKFVEFVLGHLVGAIVALPRLNRMRKCITILMQSKLRLALARGHCIHAIQEARRAECLNSTLRSWAPTTILW
jgi:hypothetical protein